jgi:cell division protein FtsW (lipid II flippase)
MLETHLASSPAPTTDQIERRLFTLAAVFLGLYALALMLAPLVRARDWQATPNLSHWLGYLSWLALAIWLKRATGRALPERDPYLLPVAVLLVGWGILTIWRLFPAFGARQAFWFLAATLLAVGGLRLPGHLALLHRYKYLWLTVGLILTGLTLLLGTNPGDSLGPRLWLGCCGIYLQPSEPLKLLLIVYLAAYLADRQPLLAFAGPTMPGKPGAALDTTPLAGQLARRAPLLPLIAPTMILIGLTLLLLLVQRDLGTASIFGFLYAVMLYLSTGRKRILLLGAASLVVAGLAGYALYDVVRLRIDAWLNPWADPSGRSYQIVQSLLAVANGGIFGRGPGLGSPNLVPIPHSDFVFTAILEENGLIGGIGLILLLIILATRGMITAIRTPDGFRRYLAAGLTAYLVGQSVLIIGGNLRFLPLTGVTLPLVSYGGSSLVSAFLAVLILLHISNRGESQLVFSIDDLPYQRVAGFLFTGLATAALVAGWWGIVRSPELLARTDNPRRAVADRFVPRGAILDRHNQPLNITVGKSGSYTRQALYPDLGPIIGYSHPAYGQSGLEASLDVYLRGLRGNPAWLVWLNQLIYGQPPPGLDVRLSLDLDLQQSADLLLGDHQGVVLLLNALSGEILVMASHPAFDPNQLDQTWAELVQDPRSPLLNRATLGRYQPGNALGPLFLAAASEKGALPELPTSLAYSRGDLSLHCAVSPRALDWGAVIAAGCPASQVALGEKIGAGAVWQLFGKLGFPAEEALNSSGEGAPLELVDPERAFLGQADLVLSPLQLALAAAALSNGGTRPAAHLELAVNLPELGWAILPPSETPQQVFSGSAVRSAAARLQIERLPIWQASAVTPNGAEAFVTWYLSGTLPSWNGAPLALVVLLEQDNAPLAEAIGQDLFQRALQP